MTAHDPIDNKSRLGKRADDLPAFDEGSPAPPISRSDRNLANFRLCVGRDRNPVILPIREDGANRLLGIGERFLLTISLSHDLRKGRNKDRKAAAGLRFQYD